MFILHVVMAMRMANRRADQQKKGEQGHGGAGKGEDHCTPRLATSDNGLVFYDPDFIFWGLSQPTTEAPISTGLVQEGQEERMTRAVERPIET